MSVTRASVGAGAEGQGGGWASRVAWAVGGSASGDGAPPAPARRELFLLVFYFTSLPFCVLLRGLLLFLLRLGHLGVGALARYKAVYLFMTTRMIL